MTSSHRKSILVSLVIGAIILVFSVLQCLHYFYQPRKFYAYLPHQTLKIDGSSIQRAIIIFYPADQELNYLPELRWLYRSWIEMIKDESPFWRTDLLIFTGEYVPSLQQLGCQLQELRRNTSESARCRVFLYVRISSRSIDRFKQQQMVRHQQVDPLFFHIDLQRSKQLHKSFENYEYIDSVNIIAEGYPIFRSYHYILKTDIDVFVTRQFSKYVPMKEATLLFGMGGYSTDFNTRRLARIARDMSWNYRNLTNIGSTWYGSPAVAQRVANLTLDAMLYLYNHEFTSIEKQRKLGVLLWPEWHYGVLSMYGTHLAINHLVSTNEYHFERADRFLDQSTTNQDQNDLDHHKRLHLHCWHTEKPFSKFQFKANKYDTIDPKTLIKDRSAQGYAMRMALESRQMTLDELSQYLNDVGVNQTNRRNFVQ